MSDYVKGFFAGFYNPLQGIKYYSAKFSKTGAVLFAGATALILYILSILIQFFICRDILDGSVAVRIALTCFLQYVFLIFGTAFLFYLSDILMKAGRPFGEIVSAVSMCVVPGSLVSILWGMFFIRGSFSVYSFFTAAGLSYSAMLLCQNLKNNNLYGRKKFFTASIVTLLSLAVSELIAAGVIQIDLAALLLSSLRNVFR